MSTSLSGNTSHTAKVAAAAAAAAAAMRANTSRLGSLLRPPSRSQASTLSDIEIGTSKLSSRTSPSVSTSRLSPVPSTMSSVAATESQTLGAHASFSEAAHSSRSPLNLSKSAIHDRLLTEQALHASTPPTPSASSLFSAQQVDHSCLKLYVFAKTIKWL